MRWSEYPEEEGEENAAQFTNAIPTETNLLFFAYAYSFYSQQEGRAIEPSAYSEPDANDAGVLCFYSSKLEKGKSAFLQPVPLLDPFYQEMKSLWGPCPRSKWCDSLDLWI